MAELFSEMSHIGGFTSARSPFLRVLFSNKYMYMQYTVDKCTLHFLKGKFMVFEFRLLCLKGSNTFLEVYGHHIIFFRASSHCHINGFLSFYHGIKR